MKHENTETKSARVEALLRASADWEPERAAPVGFAERALRKRQPSLRWLQPATAGMFGTVAAAAMGWFFMVRSPLPEVVLPTPTQVHPTATIGRTQKQRTTPTEPRPSPAVTIVKTPQRIAAQPTPVRHRAGSYRRIAARTSVRSHRQRRGTAVCSAASDWVKVVSTDPSAPAGNLPDKVVALEQPSVVVPVLYAEPNKNASDWHVTPVTVAYNDMPIDASDVPPGAISTE